MQKYGLKKLLHTKNNILLVGIHIDIIEVLCQLHWLGCKNSPIIGT